MYISAQSNAQTNFPWESPLKIAWSTDGTVFSNESIFQDSSGVPSAIRWRGDTLVCAFQWFRAPLGSLTWDKVAVKFSYDNGATWTVPEPIVVNGLPPGYQRPFDPTLARLNGDSVRIYFSSSLGMPPMGLDSTVNTYSALSTDGINYSFEPGARFDHPTNKAIDPAVLFFNGMWHYSCPAGPPQAGAYHATSFNGLQFLQQPDFPSDPLHNWTGNMLYESNSVMKFYGCGQNIWHNSTTDGFTWAGYINTNLLGGDPTAVKISPNNYLIIFVGPPNPTGTSELTPWLLPGIYPQPVTDYFTIQNPGSDTFDYTIYDISGRIISTGAGKKESKISAGGLKNGMYFIELKNKTGRIHLLRFIKQSPN